MVAQNFNNVSIRKAKKTDVNQIVKIFMEGYAKYPYNEKWSKQQALRKINYYFKNDIIYISEFNKKMVGFVIFGTYIWDKGTNGMINEIVIEKKFQGKGIGKKLMEFVEGYFKKRGIKVVALSTQKKATAAKFYKKLEYKESGLIEFKKQ